jgi:hypothetical protein
LKTVGVVEHPFMISMGSVRGNTNWVIYDVGGARNQRHAWAPFFQDGVSMRCYSNQYVLSPNSSELHHLLGANIGV